MQLELTTRHFRPAEDFKANLQKTVSDCAQKYLSNPQWAHVTVSLEDTRYSAEADVKFKGIVFHAGSEGYDLTGTVNAMIQRLEKQMRRHKEKIKNHKHKEE